MHDIQMSINIDFCDITKKIFGRDIKDELSFDLTDNITSYLTDCWGLSVEEFAVIIDTAKDNIA